MTAAHARPDLAAYAEAARMSQPELVAALRDLLGAKLVAYLGRVSETRAVRQWANRTRAIANPDDVERLRIAYRAARLIAERDTAAVAQAWFQGLNPVLDDRSPALLLRDGELADVGPQVLAAARQFAAGMNQPDTSMLGTAHGPITTSIRTATPIYRVGYAPIP